MLHINSKIAGNSTLSKALFAFKPRQVLIAERNRASKMTIAALKEEESSKITSLTPQMQGILHQSILHYLHRNGFSKTLKRFQSEAQIQNDTWKESSVHLEEIYRKYLDACNSDNNLNTSKKAADLENDATSLKDASITVETTTKKKKKKGSVENADIAVEDQSKDIDKKMSKLEVPEDIINTKSETKPKKKKSKDVLDSLGQTEEGKSNVLEKTIDDTANGLEIDDSTKKPNDKKKKKKKNSQQENVDLSIKDSKEQNNLETCTTKFDAENEGVELDATKKEKKSSKKRKRLSSDENENIATEVEISDESKRQETEALKETKNKDGEANGKPETNGREKSGSQKSSRKQHNGFTEPKTINAFQRVKIDQVEFADEKLQDNSYWAKDGADVGYGAKAQEVLGQVRGRDFRHEKTKKKRGSYRGGLIDQDSHSIKFNYSDEE